MNTSKEYKRLHTLDELRGIAIILMVLYHVLYSMTFIFSLEFAYNIMWHAVKFQPVIPIMFITLCGIVCSLSRNNLNRGIKIFAIAIVITIVTAVFMPSNAIIFGILHFLGVALILYALLEKWILKLPVSVGMVISLLLFIVLYNIPSGYIGFRGLLYFELPTQLYSCYPLFLIGLPTSSFSSSDYFPLIPNIFLFLFGIYTGKLIKEKGAPQFMYRSLCPPLAFLGRHSLFIYIIHQPIIIGVLYVVTALVR